MTETLTPQEAARALAKAQSWEAALENRTAGVTWMIWGIVMPGLFLSYAFVGVLTEFEGIDPPGWFWGTLWMPWIAMGVVATVFLWKTAALAAPAFDDPKEGRRIMWAMFALGALLSAAFAVLRPESGIVPLGGVGIMWFVAGALNLWRTSMESRVVTMTVGSLLLAVAVALAAFGAPVEVHGTVTIVASGVVPFGAGLWHVLRA